MTTQTVTYANSQGKEIKYELPEGFDINNITTNEKLRKILAVGLGISVGDDEDTKYDERIDGYETDWELIGDLTPIEQLLLIDEYSRITGLSVTAINALGSAYENGSGVDLFGYTYDIDDVGEDFSDYIKEVLSKSIFKDNFTIDIDVRPEYRNIDINVCETEANKTNVDYLAQLFRFIETLRRCKTICDIYLSDDAKI